MKPKLVGGLLAILLCSFGSAQEQIYTSPQLFSGTLYLATTRELTSTQASILNAELERTNNSGWLVGIGSTEQCEHSAIWKLLCERKWDDVPSIVNANDLSDETIARFKQLKRGSCIWIDARALESANETDRAAQAETVRACLDRGVLLVLEATNIQAGSKLADGWDLMPDIDVIRIEDSLPNESLPAKRVRIQLAKDSLLRIGRRELVNLSDKLSPDCHCSWPATKSYPEPLREAIPSRSVVELTAARRALVEREQPIFPSEQDYRPTLKSGSLVIVGGGGASAEIWEKFVELAGGKEARIVVLPTAVAEPQYEDVDEVPIMKRFGAQEVRVLRQVTREDVSTPEYLNDLRWASGIWFGGGRQWRFVDAYWGTPAWDEMKQVMARGGVIGGSSAGATIQGDLLVRGHPLGNQIMVADGYRRGLGLLEGVAIDQHFKQRNRFDDLMGVVKRFPKVVGIGIDESTALVVQSPNRCRVIGKGSVWITQPNASQRAYVEHVSGSEFEFK